MSSKGRRLTAAEMKELEGLAFHNANRTLTASERLRYEELRETERGILHGL